LTVFAIVVVAVWLYTLLREYSTGYGFAYSSFLLPLSVLLIALKPPDFIASRQALDTLMFGLGISALIGTVLPLLDIALPNQYAQARMIFGFGLDYRWVGVFETTTQASAVGTYLVLYSLWRRSRVFIVIGLIGTLILLLGYSRGALVATAVGLLAMMWFKETLFGVRLTRVLRLTTILVVLLGSTAYILVRDPSMSGRTPIWDIYARQLTPQSPWIGLGTRGIDQLVAQDPTLATNGALMHAHNLPLDLTARFGITGLILVSTLIAYVVVFAIKTGRLGLWVAPALVIALVVNQLSDIHIDWRYLDYDYSVLLFTFVLAASFLREKSEEPDQQQPPDRGPNSRTISA